MTHAEWLEVGRKELALWPNQPWEPTTMAAAYELFQDIPLEPALKAIAELAAEGREFAPAPGVVLSRTAAIMIASTPLLRDPDVTRPLTPEEAERAQRMAGVLAGGKARLVVATWMEFAAHARLTVNDGETAEGAAERIKACEGRCGWVANRCRRSAPQSNVYPPMLSHLCPTGRPLFEAWRYAVDGLRTAASPAGAVQQEAPL